MIGAFYSVSRASTPDSEQDSIAGEIMRMKGEMDINSNDWYSDGPLQTTTTTTTTIMQGCGGRLWDTEINLFDDLDVISVQKQFVVDQRPWSVDISDLQQQQQSNTTTTTTTTTTTQHQTTNTRRPASLPSLKFSSDLQTDVDSCECSTDNKTTAKRLNSDSSSESNTECVRAVAKRVEVSASAVYQQKKASRLQLCQPTTTDITSLTPGETPYDLLTTPAGFYDRPSFTASNVVIRPLFEPVTSAPSSPDSADSESVGQCAVEEQECASEVEEPETTEQLTSLYTVPDSADVDTLDCVRSVLQTVLPDEIALTNNSNLKLLTQLYERNRTSTPKRDGMKHTKSSVRPVIESRASHLNPDAPSFDYYSVHPTAIYPVTMAMARPTVAMPVTFTPMMPLSRSSKRLSPRHQRQQMSAAMAANLVWRPTPLTVTYAPVYDGNGAWSHRSTTSAGTPAAMPLYPTGLPLYTYYTQPVYVIGSGPVHLMNHSAINAVYTAQHRKRQSSKHTSPVHSRAAA